MRLSSELWTQKAILGVPKLAIGVRNENRLFFLSFFFLVILGLHPRHVKVPRLGAKLELQLLAYTTATATPDWSHVCDLHHSSWQHRILNLLSEARY